MDVLPDEMLLKIFDCFHPVYGNLASHGLVCRKWNDVLKTSSLWRHIHLEDDSSVVDSLKSKYETIILSCLKRFGRHVHCIRSEQESYFLDPELRTALSSLPNVRHLNVPVLAWTRVYIQSLQSAPHLKSITIDDFRNLLVAGPGKVNKSSLQRNGLRIWDLKLLAQNFPGLEKLSLNICYYKLCRNELLPILDTLKLKELKLECVPFGMNRPMLDRDESPIKLLVLSRHASILTLLEMCHLPLSMDDLILFLAHLKSLRHLTVGVIDVHRHSEESPTLLESQSLGVFVCYGLSTPQNEKWMLVMPKLEVLVLSQCRALECFEARVAKRVLTFVVRDSFKLKSLSVACERIAQMVLEDCPSLDLRNFRHFLSRIPKIHRLEISQDWETLELEKPCSSQLRKLILRNVSVSMTKVRIICPSLWVFKCTGSLEPIKQRREYPGCAFSIRAEHLKKVQINDVIGVKRISLKSDSGLDFVQIGAVEPWEKPTKLLLRSKHIGEVNLRNVPLNRLQVCASKVNDLLIEQCDFTRGSPTLKMVCRVVRALRFVRCTGITEFTLGARNITTLSIDSCEELRHLNLRRAKVGRVRIENCPQLELESPVASTEHTSIMSPSDHFPANLWAAH